ncbi:hypothetical protein [Argonema galeatum]|uniref:hypothetical protein n=1 Tax=Argonema galeatum TaxID=2942762 RepID=UPI0020127B6E|nr:hypothetical protein [Argonema galeatum]MCL1464698.1 hypothetical protein [Argonema galeatum A003/A1]
MTQTSNPGIPFEVDGEVTYLSPNSAEGKALQRIRAIEAGEDVEWITTIQEGDLIDTEALDNWLTKRGYPIEVSDSSTQSGV